MSGITQARLAKMLGTTDASISRWENGKTRPYEEDVEKLDAALGCHGQLMQTWRREVTGSLLPPWQKSIPALEQEARTIEIVSPTLIPGVLQSPSYIRWILRESLFPGSDEELEQEVKARSSRYDALTAGSNPWIVAIFPENALTVPPDPIRHEQASLLLSRIENDRLHVHFVAEAVMVRVIALLMVFHLKDGTVVSASEHNRGVILHDDPRETRLTEILKMSLGDALSLQQSKEQLKRMVSDVA